MVAGMLGCDMAQTVYGTNLRQRREEKGISGNELARLAKIDPSTLSKIERGIRPPSKPEMKRISELREIDLPLLIQMAWARADKLIKMGLNKTPAEKDAIRQLSQPLIGPYKAPELIFYSPSEEEAVDHAYEEYESLVTKYRLGLLDQSGIEDLVSTVNLIYPDKKVREEVFHDLGLVTPPIEDIELKELLQITKALPPAEREEVMKFARSRLEHLKGR